MTPLPTKSPSAERACAVNRSWPKQRILFLLAGSFTLTGTLLAFGVSRWFALVPMVVGANQLLMVATGWCPVSLLLDHILPSEPSQPPAKASA